MDVDKKIIIILGAGGQLGSEIVKALDEIKFSNIEKYLHLSKRDFDFEDEYFLNKLASIIVGIQKEKKCQVYVVNTAAYHNLKDCEENPDKSYLYNEKIVASMASMFKNRLFHVSTDYVFGGYKREFYDPLDTVCPLNIYGMSKALGENSVLNYGGKVIRVAGLYGKKGATMKGNTNFILNIYKKLKAGEKVFVNADVYTCITSAQNAAKQIVKEINDYRDNIYPEIYHLTDKGGTNWFEVASYIGELLNKRDLVYPKKSDNDLKRPKNSVLTSDNYHYMKPWKESVKEFIEELENEGK